MKTRIVKSIINYTRLLHLTIFYYPNLPQFAPTKNPIAMLSILLTSDHQSSREAFARTLAAEPFFHLIDVCADVHAAMSISSREQPDIVLIDGSTDPLMAIEATKKILSVCAANVIAISRHMEKSFVHHMLAAGALGYITTQSSAAEIIPAVHAVAKDNVYLCEAFRNEEHVLQLPTPIKAKFSFKESIASFREQARKKISTPAELHWHSILKYTN